MSSWSIKPEGVSAVLKKLDPDLKALSGQLRVDKLEAIPQKLTSGAPVTAKVQAAMQALLADQGDEMTTIVNHVSAGMQGVVNATIAYHRAGEEQAATFQREMVKAARTGDFGYFAKHGYKDS